MTRNLKTLGLALVAVLAMAALGASAAQAEDGTLVSANGTTIDATNASHGVHTFDIEGLPQLTCTEVTGEAPFEGGSSLTSSEISYETCHLVRFGITFPATVTMNECDYTFEVGTPNGSGGWNGSVTIGGCDENESITIDVYKPGTPNNHEAHTDPDNKFCEIHVPEQKVEGLTYTNGETESVMAVTVEANQAPVTTELTNHGTPSCEQEGHTTAAYNGDFWAKATNEKEEYVDVTVE